MTTNATRGRGTQRPRGHATTKSAVRIIARKKNQPVNNDKEVCQVLPHNRFDVGVLQLRHNLRSVITVGGYGSGPRQGLGHGRLWCLQLGRPDLFAGQEGSAVHLSDGGRRQSSVFKSRKDGVQRAAKLAGQIPPNG